MDSSKSINYFFRRYSFVRWIFALALLIAILTSIFVINSKKKIIPEIYAVIPPVGSPGDEILIKGKGFGQERNMSYVEIAGSKLTASAYISWTDDCIKIILPSNVQDGLVVVGTSNGRSKSALFANEEEIPLPVSKVTAVTKPSILYLSSDKVNVGDILTIQGNNFGESRQNSKVLFTADYTGKLENAAYQNPALISDSLVKANEDFFDYVSWSDTEIKVHVPDGACTGLVAIEVNDNLSDGKALTVLKDSGNKKYFDKKVYLVEYTADIDDVVSTDYSNITLRCPLPITSVSQPRVEITEVTPEPVIANFQNDMIHQLLKIRTGAQKAIFKQTFVIDVYGVETNVNPAKIGNYRDSDASLLSIASRSDSLIKSDDERIIELSKKIIGIEKNYYKRAQLIYNFMLENYRILQNLRKNDADPLDMLETKEGDAYDFAIIFTALLRAAGIPSFTDSGVLVSQDLSTQSHWWTEFYISKAGWIPCDIAIAAGLNYKKWPNDIAQDDKKFYFGSLDSHHITFSRGWTLLKPFAAENKVVQQPRSFALQSIWEEANESTVKYSSYWSVPVVKGVYK